MLSSRIIPVIFIVWGALVVLRTVLGPHVSGAYGAGQLAAGFLGLVVVTLGVRTLVRG